MGEGLSTEERSILLHLARQALESGVRNQPLEPLDLDTLPEQLRETGVTFVTLTEREMLRGCVGALEAYQPLAEDVREHAIAAALEDYRFPPVRPEEIPWIKIEISRLTTPVPLEYDRPEDLPKLLRRGVDGVVLRDGMRRATFLPQVWEKIPDKAEFLANLCYKMGAAPDTWKKIHLEVLIYHVEEFHE